MLEFNYQEYQNRLASSTIITDCDMVPVPACAEHQNYIFISYSHRDYKKVYHDLAHMYQSGVRFWYDAALTAGQDWDNEVFQKINDPHCSGVVFYISDDFFRSQSVYKEILTTLGKNKKLSSTGLAKNYFCVNLTSKMPSELIADNFVFDSEFEKELGEEFDLKSFLKDVFRDNTTYISFGSKGYSDKLLVQIRRNFNVIDLTGDDASLVGEYVGEMLKGKRTGYGICKYSNGIVYEGEWKDNKYHGRGRLSYPEGDHRDYLEGIFVEHKANGHCIFRLRNGDCFTGNMTNGEVTGHFTYTQKDGYTYIGDMVAGRRQGKGKLIYPENSNTEYYEGEWKGNNQHGFGFAKFRDGASYEGEWANGHYCGKGRYVYGPESEYDYYDGEWLNQEKNGQGIIYFKNGDSWVGEWKEGTQYTGFGTYKFHKENNVYYGELKNGLLEGAGRFTYNPESKIDYYEGSFLNGKRNGKGTMQFKSGEVYTGEWLDDQYSGYGEMIHSNGCHYEGHWRNSKRNGHGKYTYSANSNMDFYEGNWQDDKRNGYGVLVYKNGTRWEGEWENGAEVTGYGTYHVSGSGRVYLGELKDKQFCGQGKYTYAAGEKFKSYEGSWLNGKKNGYGILVFSDGSFYEGEFSEGEYHGKGRYTYREMSNLKYYDGQWAKSNQEGFGILEFVNGERYEGEWLNGLYHGKGKLFYGQSSNIEYYDGEWREDKKNGYGVQKMRDGAVYEGEFVSGVYHGKGKRTYSADSYIDYYEGEFSRDTRSGYGIIVFKAGDMYEGEWADDEYNGFGKYTYKPDTDIDYYEGNWFNSKQHGTGILVYKNADQWEGEWKNGERYTGHGAMHESGDIVYHGDWVNGKINGKGKVVSPDGVYEGELKNGRYNGYGVYTYNTNPQLWEKYEGEWVDGNQSGHGVLTMVGGSYYDGQWNDGFWHGQGTFCRKGTFRSYKTNGYWVNGKYDWSRHKLFAWIFDRLREEYVGETKDGLRHGKGWCKDSQGEYEGNWENNARSGKGVQKFKDGSVYDGEWKNNTFTGFGIHQREGFHYYEGHWENNLKQGYGCYKYRDGSVYEGYWEKDRINGEGTFTDKENNILKGTFKKDKFLSGTITLSDGSATIVENGKPADKAIAGKLPHDTKTLLKKVH